MRTLHLITAVTILASMVCAPREASADDQAAVVLPFATATFKNTDSRLEAGGEWQPQSFRIRVLGRFPFVKDSKPPTVSFDKDTDTWRAVLSIQNETDLTTDSGAANLFRYGVDLEWGVAKYAYNPDGATEEKKESHSSYAAELRFLWYHGAPKSNGIQFAPQVYGRYDRSYKDADKEQRVTPKELGVPAVVKEVIPNPPSAKPQTLLRLAMPLYGFGGPVAIGPAVALAMSGDNGDTIGSSLVRTRAEMWVYFFPKDDGKSNVRIGLAPFYDRRLKGTDKRDETEYGALLQLRVGTNLLEY